MRKIYTVALIGAMTLSMAAVPQKKNKPKVKAEVPQLSEEQKARQMLRDEMLAGRVQKLVVIDSLSASAHGLPVRLSTPSGYLVAPGSEWDGVGFESEDGTLRLLARTDTAVARTENMRYPAQHIYETWRLLDGTWSEPQRIMPDVQDAAFPYMLSDGQTLYFASQTEPGLGHYDLFRANRDPETGEFMEPVNMGMPYNSPDDDFLLIVDEYSALGWLGTNRGREPRATAWPEFFYLYLPGELRINYDADTPGIEELGELSTLYRLRAEGDTVPGWRLTWAENADYTQKIEAMKKLPLALQRAKKVDSSDLFPEPYITSSGRVYHAYSELPDAASRQEAKDYFRRLKALRSAESELQQARADWQALRSQTAAETVQRAEQRVEKLRRELR